MTDPGRITTRLEVDPATGRQVARIEVGGTVRRVPIEQLVAKGGAQKRKGRGRLRIVRPNEVKREP